MILLLKILSVILLSIITGVFYRMGGSGNYPRYFRELSACVTMILAMVILGHIHWTLIPCAGLLYGLETTYFKSKNSDAKWWNWLLVGIAFSIAMLPLVIAQHLWIGFGIRTVFCTGMVVLWQEFLSQQVVNICHKTLNKDITDEFGRGFLVIITLPFLLI